MIKRSLFAALAAVAIFALVALPTGALAQLDDGYCAKHPDRPTSTTSEEERLSLMPPGTECTFTQPDRSMVVEGPDWWLGIALLGGVVTGLLVLSEGDRAPDPLPRY